MIADKVVTFDGYKYSTGMQTLIFELLSCHVSTRKIPVVINAVSKLLERRVSHIPKRSCINNMSIQMLSLSQNQLGEEFSEEQNTTLLSDETTKYDKRGMFPEEVPTADPFMIKTNESATCCLMRTCSKAFARGSDAKNGVHLEFSAYVQQFLKENKLHTLPLAPYRGNRFNILFANASHVFFLRMQFLTFLNGRENNSLLKSVLHDLKCPEFISCCKALGLISKYVTTPLWSLIEDKSIHVMDMSKHYKKLVESLEYAFSHINEFLEGKILVFGDSTPINRESCLAELLKPFEHDNIVQSILLVIIPTLIKLCKKLFADHLTSGKFGNVEQDSDLYKKTKSVPKHNKFAESIFAYMDCVMKAKPNVSLLTCEALIMFAKNKTAEWLTEKGEKDMAAVLAHPRKSREKVSQEFRRRQREIKEARRLETLRKQQEEERKRQDRLRKLECYTDAIITHGLWQSLEQVDELLLLYKTKSQKLEAAKAQIYFREHVLGQKPADKKLFLKSVSLEQMIINVKKLIEDAGSTVVNSERHMLVGKKIRHRQETEQNGIKSLKWFEGKVCSQVTGYPAWFNVKYKDDDAIYTYRLGEDLERGDIQILYATD